MVEKLLNFIQGYLIIEISGNALERFISQLIAKNIKLWSLERKNKKLYRAKIYKDDFNKIRPVVSKRMCRVEILKKIGLPFILFKINRRYMLFLGFIFFIGIFYLAASFMWFINIEGLEEISEERIHNILEEREIRPGILKAGIDVNELEKYFLREEPAISWINIYWQGTQLNIKIVERQIIQEEEPSEIVAGRDGIITEIFVLKGKALVGKGDTVIAGQPLIKAHDKEEKDIKGIVRAKVWYEAEATVNFLDKNIIYTGEQKSKWGIKAGNFFFWFPFLRSPSFTNYKKEIKIISPEWRNFSFPIEIIKEDYKKINYIENKREYSTALYTAKTEAFKGILKEIDSETVIQKTKYEVIEETDDKIQVRVLVQGEENIAQNIIPDK